ncbi:hypothetical protein C8Q74DRAFT_1372436 [Fomes fomentarius]|nr:hypothetical protein C8Q74DRAFT_1372436 [Fomes fomentarius]
MRLFQVNSVQAGLKRDNEAVLLRVDDGSWRVQYGGQWAASSVTSPGDQNASTIHTSGQAGATVKFAFNGTFVAVYGILDGQPVTASFTIDDREPVTQAITQPPPSLQYNWPFFATSTPLDSGLHELTVTVRQGSFNLDYIQYTSVDGMEGVGDSGTIRDDGTHTPAQGQSAARASQTPVFSNTPLSTGAVAGIAVAGAVVVLGIVAMLFCVFCRRAKRVRHRRIDPEKRLDMIVDAAPKRPPEGALRGFRRFSRVYRPTPARSAQSSKTATSSARTQSSAMFTSVIMLSPTLSFVTEEPEGNHHAV